MLTIEEKNTLERLITTSFLPSQIQANLLEQAQLSDATSDTLYEKLSDAVLKKLDEQGEAYLQKKEAFEQHVQELDENIHTQQDSLDKELEEILSHIPVSKFGKRQLEWHDYYAKRKLLSSERHKKLRALIDQFSTSVETMLNA